MKSNSRLYKKRKNVLHIIDKYGIGGVESMCQGLFEEFHSNKYNLIFYFLRNLHQKKEVRSNRVIINNYKKWSFSPFFDIMKKIEDKKIDIVHTHHRKGFYMAWALSRIFSRVKFIHHEHGDILLGGRIYKFFTRMSGKNIRFIAVSKYTKECLIKAGVSKEKIYVLNNFLNPNKYKIFQKTNLIKTKKEFSIGYVGRLCKIKGVETLVKAIPHLEKRCFLNIYGDGPSKKNLLQLTKILNLSKRIKFHSFEEDPKKIYSGMDLLVVPSLSESFGLTIIEAQIAGIPTIVSDIPALDEVIPDNNIGLRFKKGNPEDLAKKINFLLSNEKIRIKIAKNGKKNAGNYNIKRYIPALERIYDEGP